VRYFSYADERLDSFTTDRVLLEGIEIVPPARRAPRRLQAILLGTGQARRLLRACDVVRAYQAPGGLPGALAGARLVSTYGYDYEDFTSVQRLPRPFFEQLLAGKRRAVRDTTGFVLRRSIATIATTRSGADKARRLGAPRVELIPNGVDVGLFSPSRDNEAEFDVAYVGRLDPLKDVATLLSGVEAANGDVRLLVVGDGDERQSLQAAATGRGLDVVFAGTLPNRNIADLLRRTRCFVLPSRAEGHPKALLEAMAAGLPCIAADIPAIREFPAEALLRFPPGDADELGSNLRRLLADARLRASLGAKARALAVERFDLRKLVGREAELLASVGAA
jgi:glycosyltransferase involved in cell wall biosynthesis